MPRLTAAAAAALLAASTGCTAAEPMASPAPSPPPSSGAAAPVTRAPTPAPSTRAPEGESLAATALLGRLRDFAGRPTQEKLEALPLADEVALGLGETVIKVLPGEKLLSPTSWVLEQPLFRAATGPFDLLEPLRDPRPATVSLGAHPHCASPPRPAPDGYTDAQRISTQPAKVDSCLQWYSVDVFVRDKQVAAVTYDVWEP